MINFFILHFQRNQITFGVESCHTACPGRGYGLTIDVILSITAGKNAGYISSGTSFFGQDIPTGIQLEKLRENARIWRVTNSDEKSCHV